jgi:hypothetical protein
MGFLEYDKRAVSTVGLVDEISVVSPTGFLEYDKRAVSTVGLVDEISVVSPVGFIGYDKRAVSTLIFADETTTTGTGNDSLVVFIGPESHLVVNFKSIFVYYIW